MDKTNNNCVSSFKTIYYLKRPSVILQAREASDVPGDAEGRGAEASAGHGMDVVESPGQKAGGLYVVVLGQVDIRNTKLSWSREVLRSVRRP